MKTFICFLGVRHDYKSKYEEAENKSFYHLLHLQNKF
jgi:hypothetical protein